MRRLLVAGALAAIALAGAAEARGRYSGAARRPHVSGGRHRTGMREIAPIKSLGPAEFRPYEPAKPLRPFSYVDHERRGKTR